MVDNICENRQIYGKTWILCRYPLHCSSDLTIFRISVHGTAWKKSKIYSSKPRQSSLAVFQLSEFHSMISSRLKTIFFSERHKRNWVRLKFSWQLSAEDYVRTQNFKWPDYCTSYENSSSENQSLYITAFTWMKQDFTVKYYRPQKWQPHLLLWLWTRLEEKV